MKTHSDIHKISVLAFAEGNAGSVVAGYGNPVGRPVQASINHGRWIAVCECYGAEYIDPGAPFFCLSCRNSADSHEWRPVMWPADQEAIEAELERRPEDAQHWTVETLDELKTETILWRGQPQ